MSAVIRPYSSAELSEVLRLFWESSDSWPGTDASMRLLLDSRAFEREHFAGNGSRATTDDFLAAIAVTRATLTPEMVEDFVADTERFART